LTILSADDLTKSFGSIAALRGVCFSLAAGEIRAICGENGAGKSTFVKLLMGILEPDRGTIVIAGKPQTIRSPQQAQALGLGLVSQELSLVPHLSILDNIWLGSPEVPLWHRRRDLRARALRALAALGADDWDLDRPVAELAIGQRQIVEIARQFARNARVLILDEPTATLSDVEIERIFGVLKALKSQGRSVIYITHRLGEVFEICDTVSVFRNGEHVATRKVADVTRERLIELMLGRSVADMYPKAEARGTGTGALEVAGLAIPGVMQDFAMVAPRGKILCIAGQLGSGAMHVPRALAGLVPEARGRVAIDGKELRLGSVPRALARNLMLISEDRAAEGLFPAMSVLDNLVATRLGRHRRFGVLSWPGLRRVARRLAERVGVDRRRLPALAIELSGGNQQKLLFGRALEGVEPGILLMSEPTRGVDVGARAEIYRLMREFCDLGYALLMTSSDLEEVVGLADIVITLFRGRIVAQYERPNIAMASILADITHPAPARPAA